MVETTFHGITLATEPGAVFTPRPATEQLVDAALGAIGAGPLRIADVGTGTGAIAVAIAAARPLVEVWASDRSADAVRVARLNAERNGVGARVHVVQGHLLDPLPGAFDLIVANLPYLPESVHRDEYDDEPPEAVYAPGDGLGYYRTLLGACEAGKLVIPGGKVVLQLHREVLEADCWQLKALRKKLDELRRRAA
jgi:release factor glutamine methyltransferase